MKVYLAMTVIAAALGYIALRLTVHVLMPDDNHKVEQEFFRNVPQKDTGNKTQEL